MSFLNNNNDEDKANTNFYFSNSIVNDEYTNTNFSLGNRVVNVNNIIFLPTDSKNNKRSSVANISNDEVNGN